MQGKVRLLAVLGPFETAGPVLVSLERRGDVGRQFDSWQLVLEESVQRHRLVVPRALDGHVKAVLAGQAAFNGSLTAVEL